jgi:hypothetical protein
MYIGLCCLVLVRGLLTYVELSPHFVRAPSHSLIPGLFAVFYLSLFLPSSPLSLLLRTHCFSLLCFIRLYYFWITSHGIRILFPLRVLKGATTER